MVGLDIANPIESNATNISILTTYTWNLDALSADNDTNDKIDGQPINTIPDQRTPTSSTSMIRA